MLLFKINCRNFRKILYWWVSSLCFICTLFYQPFYQRHYMYCILFWFKVSWFFFLSLHFQCLYLYFEYDFKTLCYVISNKDCLPTIHLYIWNVDNVNQILILMLHIFLVKQMENVHTFVRPKWIALIVHLDMLELFYQS